MIAFSPPHDPNSPEGIEYAAIQERIRQYRRESEAMDREMQKVVDDIGNPAVATLGLMLCCAIPGVLMLIMFFILKP